jgi:hypothetical protein
VCIEGAAKPASPAPAASAHQRSATPAGSNGKVACTVHVGQSGLLCCRGSAENTAPTDLIGRLGTKYPLYLVVDFNRLDLAVPEGIDEPSYLLPWLPEEKRAKFSPIILSAADGVDLIPLVEAGWGKDGLIAVFSAGEPANVLQRIQGKGSAFVRPSVVSGQLERQAQPPSHPLLEDIDAVLVEDGGPDRWTIFAAAEMEQTLDELGFKNAPSGE